MYTLFCQKREGMRAPFPLTHLLNDLISFTCANGVFVSPGHLSKDPIKVEKLLDGLLAPVSTTNITKFGIGNKYGGNYIHIYEDYLDNRHILWKVNRNGRSDHRKMVFIFKYEEPIADLSLDNYKKIAEQIEIIGVAIGSSNFSYATYGSILTRISKADKGEADILMFNDDAFKEHITKQLSNKLVADKLSDEPDPIMVLSESITYVPNDFLKRMFLEMLECTLA